MKPLNFSKSGSSWIRGNTWLNVINLQLSQWNSAEEAKFTINLGISIPELHSALESLPFKGSVKEYDCDIRLRIGRLLPKQTDFWWAVTMGTQPAELTKEVFAYIEQYALPWFDRLTDYNSLAAEFMEEKSPFKAALAFNLAGDSSSAERALTEALKTSNIHSLPKLKRIATKQGIQIIQ
ncbi:DUF4304 domain-containing protein [Luteolibacter yonseiensis]|uniref:DUF4304 domain-containing protein n=1 Tax=Luteolibacter yonseiensis TaxID=1144680 RepID=A0A934R8D0_9BACT|nr:DUF4304 domain-containing protein [Luteolibacter yonseiensis]MBK1817335.1 DUF4304 domain-containing protein [Luteolibacter yonseiensis]